MSEHTPGPWHVVPGVYDTNPETASEFPHGPEILAAGGNHIASLGLYSEDDARLIAAAPDMLAALQDLMEFIEGRTPLSKLPEQARAAIAKATQIDSVR